MSPSIWLVRPKLEPVETPVALDQIRVLPGTFFLHCPTRLCYYDQVVLPGKVIDQALSAVHQDLSLPA